MLTIKVNVVLNECMTAINEAINAAGGVSELAALLNEAVATVSAWKSRGRAPAEKCRAIEEAIKGRVTRYELRPDVFGPAPKPRTKKLEQQQKAA